VIVFFILLMNAFPGILPAQSFHGGFKAGICGSQVSGDNLEGYDKAGILFGGFVSHSLPANFSLSFGIEYIQKGSKSTVNPDDNSFYKMRLNYVEVPLLLRWNAGAHIFFEAGPSFGVLVSSSEENQIGEFESIPPFKKYEFSGNIGLGYSFDEHWSIEGLYNGSIIPVRPFEGSYNSNYFNRGQYNSVLELSMIYLIK